MFAQLEEMRNIGRKFKKQVKESVGVKHIAGTNEASSEGTTHSVKDNELNGFVDWINKYVVQCNCMSVTRALAELLTFATAYLAAPLLNYARQPWCSWLSL